MKTIYLAAAALLLLAGCKKESLPPKTEGPLDGFTEYIIPQGQQYSNGASLSGINTSNYRFQAYFDSSAIYTVPVKDQHDINKLSGFADNGGSHLDYSARVGWRWSDNALRLFGYVHNNGVFQEKEIGSIAIGKVYTCSIEVQGSSYRFSVEGIGAVSLPREATSATGQGYRLYPYFGGNNTAPHDIHIWLKYLN